MTTLDSTPRRDLLERGRSGGRLAGRLRNTHGRPLSVGKRGDPGGLQNARRFANRTTRPSHCISDDVGKTEMSGNTPPLKGGQVSLHACQAAQNCSHNRCGRRSQCYLYICRGVDARSVTSKTHCWTSQFFCETDQEREYCWAWTAMWAWHEFGTKTWWERLWLAKWRRTGENGKAQW